LIKIVSFKNSFVLLFDDIHEVLSHFLSFWRNFHVELFPFFKDLWTGVLGD
jgi:hypothetical protein